MKITDNTILITGGASGIGFALASKFVSLGNTVIITGRDQNKLNLAQKTVPGIHVFQNDVSSSNSIELLYEKIKNEFPNLNMLINNAGIMHKFNFNNTDANLEQLTEEIEINLKGPIFMIRQFMPLLKEQKSSAIINVTSALAFVPLPISPIYCASKAALHSFTLSLRIQLDKSNIKVFELAPPVVDTSSLRTIHTEETIKNLKPMDVSVLVNQTLDGIKNDKYEICPGASKILKLMNRIAPNFILKQLSKSVSLS